MEFLLTCDLPEVESEVETEVFCRTADDIENETDLITDFCNMNAGFTISGFFDEDEVSSELISSLKETISDLGERMIVTSSAYDDDGNLQESIDIQVADFALSRGYDVLLDPSNIAGCLNWNIESFLERGEWHIGFFGPDGSYVELNDCLSDVISLDENKLRYKPVIWFGLNEEGPLQQWVVSGDEDSMAFWFDEMGKSDFVERISDCDDATITWYFLECGFTPPELKSTLEACPIVIEQSDNEDSLRGKIQNYILKYLN